MSKSKRAFLPPVRWAPEELRIWTVEEDGLPYGVSVILPVYNAERYVAEAVHSVFAQRYFHGGMQVVAVDDGSTDGSPEVLRELQREYGEAMVVIPQPNRGAAAARNLAMRRATGRYYMFQDADDVSPATRLKTCLQALEDYECDVVYGQKETFLRSTDVRGWHPPASQAGPGNIHSGCGFGTGALFMRADKALWLDESMAGAEDHELLIAMLAEGRKVQCLKDTVLYRRDVDGSLRHQVDWTLARHWAFLKHRAFLEHYTGKRLPVFAEQEAAVMAARKAAGW